MSRPIRFGEPASALFRLEAATAVSAGAGSGKTTALVELCVRLLSGEALGTACDPGEIAAITFTEKAAEELVERLREAVLGRARDASRAGPEADAQAWIERLHGLERMPAGTIHSFCGRILREHAPEAGLDPDFAVVDEERARSWLSAAARGAVVAALDAGRPAARDLAAALGAGGRRGALATVLADLVRERSTRGEAGRPEPSPAREGEARDAWDRLRAATRALAAAGASASGEGARAVVEDVAAALERLPPDAGQGSLGPRELVGISALAAATKGRGKRLGKADGAIREAREALVAAAGEVRALEAERLAGPQKEELAALVADAEARYAAAKREARALDFDDLLVRTRDLLARDAALRTELRTRIRALLVDEYQDVNAVQQQIFDLVAGVGAGAADAGGPLLVAVGDLKQSIYRFRGADVSVFARLMRRLAAGEGRVLHLSENHRSSPAVLDLVNDVVSRCMQPPAGVAPRDDEIRFTEADRLVPTREQGPGPACELLVDDGEKASAAERRAREAEAIVSRIRAIVSGNAGVAVRERGDGGERTRRPRHGDVAILFRRLTQIGPYERALRAAGIPYRLARGGGFYQAPEVRDVGELLASLFDPADAIAWAAALRSPMCAVTDGTLLLLARVGFSRAARLGVEALLVEADRVAGLEGAISPDERARLARFLDTWRELRAIRDRLPVADLLARAVASLDLDAALLAGPDGERRAVNLEKVLALAARFEADGGRAADLPARLRTLASLPPREPEAELEAGDAVAVLSVHQAKGLEWPIVFVPDLGARPRTDVRRALLDGEGRICAMLADPAAETFFETISVQEAREGERRAAAAEARRLLYVALTRARDHLVLSGEDGGGGTWRALVDATVASRPELVRLVRMADASSAAGGPALDAEPGAELPAEEALAAPRLAAPAPVAAVRAAVTDLAEWARCPRRHRFARVLRIPEPFGDPRSPADDPARATARGTLAHAMLSETDLGAPPLERRAQMAAAAARRGHDPSDRGVRRILAEVGRFADSEGGREIALAGRDGRLSREVPFLMRLDGDGVPSAYLVGAIDALISGRRGEGVTVVDYKYAINRPGSAERYRIQLLAYALAARRAHSGARVRARIQFLRGDLRSVDVTPTEADLSSFAREAPRLAWDAHRGARGELAPADLGRDEARCRAEGCGYVGRCYAPRSPRSHDLSAEHAAKE